MSDPKCAGTLMDAAELDLRALEGMGEIAVFSEEIAGFHAQQAAEKLIKAWLAISGLTYPLTHDLDQLLDLLRGSAPDCERYRGLSSLTPFAVRLPCGPADSTAQPLDRKSLAGMLRSLQQHVQSEFDSLPSNCGEP